MIINTHNIQLVRQDSEDIQVKALLQDLSILESMSEANSYPGPMPEKICFRIEKDGRITGQVCLKRIRWINHKAEISLFVIPEAQGMGMGWAALEAIISYGFNRLNLYRLEAEVIENNAPSIRLMKKAGFTEEGRLREAKFMNGSYHDLLRFGLLRREFDTKTKKSS